MAASEPGLSHPGLSVGPTSEFSLFFRVKPGQGPSLRARSRDLQDTPGYRPGDYGMAIQTIHEARFVLFDDDTRLAFITSFDGPWDAYMEDFFTSGPTLALFDVIFRHVEGYDGLPDLAAAARRFVLGAEQTAAAYARNYGGTVKEIRKAAARERRLPAGARPPAGRRDPRASGDAAAARRGRRLARGTGPGAPSDVGPHLRAARPRRPDRGHHRRVRVPEPRAAGSSRPRREHAADGQALRPVLGGTALPLPAATPQPADGRRSRVAVRPRPTRSTSSTASSPLRIRAAGRAPGQAGHLHLPDRRVGLVPRQRPAGRLRCAACGSSPAPAGTRSSWTRAPP